MNIEIREGYLPSTIGRVSELHAEYYHSKVGFGVEFEAKVATELSEYCLRYGRERDGLWLAVADGRIEASIAIAGPRGEHEAAQLRWFITSEKCRGTGIGSKLLETALRFSDAMAYSSVYLWTFAGLPAARHLYEKSGFKLEEERLGRQWGGEVKEQRFVRRMA